MKKRTPVWQRAVCGLLSIAGLVALVSSAVHSGFSDVWATVVWLFGVYGVVLFGAFAVSKGPVYRDVNDLPRPSARIEQLLTAHSQVGALKAYREEADVSLFEARAVIEHYWPNS